MFRQLVSISCLLCALSLQAGAQISARSIDLGVGGFYFGSPLVISYGGASLAGTNRQSQLNGQLGAFISDNFALGLRWRSDMELFQVERQFFNQQTHTYEPYKHFSKSQLYGLYGRYYLDFGRHLAVFAHAEFGIGSSLIRVTEQNNAGGVDYNKYPRSLTDNALGLGLALRPLPEVGLEISLLRRTRAEAYFPGSATSGQKQVETYGGYEMRIGLRLNFNFFDWAAQRKVIPPGNPKF
ncbi:hypothetical protein GC194_09220 [bacterium]|nr:hypothetical protein [bacterium]